MPSAHSEQYGARISLHLDRDLCVGAGNCASMLPEIFDQTADDGRSVLKMSSVDSSLAEAVDEVVDLCPAGAIRAERGTSSRS